MANKTKESVNAMVAALMKDGVDACVIDDMIARPAHYIRATPISALAGDDELPLFCFYDDSLLTEEQKEKCLTILSENVCMLMFLITTIF